MKCLAIILFSISMTVSYAQTVTATNTVLAGLSSTSLQGINVEGSGGTTVSSPITVYIPMYKSTGAAEYISSNYYINGTSSNMPQVTSDLLSATSGMVRHDVSIDNTSLDTVYLYAGVIDNNSTGVFDVISGQQMNGTPPTSVSGILATIGGDSNVTVTVDLYLNNICHTANGFDCTNIYSGSNNEGEVSPIIYFFTSTTSLNRFTGDLSTSSYPNGVYYKYRLNNQVINLYNSNPTLTDLVKGDGRLRAVYAGPLITEFKDVIILKKTSGTFTTGDLMSTALGNGTIISSANPVTTDGSITVKELTNEVSYEFSAAFVNKWNFATTISNSLTETPQGIETFLEAQSCYLLSAGFQEKHFVLDYFRQFRDQTLLNYSMGKAFVQFYYKTAPHYARIIYKNNTLSFIVRCFGYFLYYIFNYALIIFGIIFLMIFLILRRSYKRRVSHEF